MNRSPGKHDSFTNPDSNNPDDAVSAAAAKRQEEARVVESGVPESSKKRSVTGINAAISDADWAKLVSRGLQTYSRKYLPGRNE